MCFQSFHKVCMCEVSGTCTPLQLLKSSVKLEVMGQIEIKQTFCGHLWTGFSTKSIIFWRGLANSFTTPWLHVLTAISAIASTAIFPSCFSLKGSIACHALASHGFMDAKVSTLNMPCPLVDSLNGATLWQTAPSSALRLVRAEAFLRP